MRALETVVPGSSGWEEINENLVSSKRHIATVRRLQKLAFRALILRHSDSCIYLTN